MEKVTKKKQIEELQTVVAAQWRQINKLKLHLGRLVDIDWSDEQGSHDEVVAILDSKEPKLKQLDHSVFDGLDAKWRFAAFNIPSNSPIVFSVKPHESMFGKWYAVLDVDEYMVLDQLEGAYEYTEDWQNSLIERKELTGSDLCRAMLERGDKYVMCVTGALRELIIIDTLQDGKLYSFGTMYENPIPINNQGEPLTATDVGL